MESPGVEALCRGGEEALDRSNIHSLNLGWKQGAANKTENIFMLAILGLIYDILNHVCK